MRIALLMALVGSLGCLPAMAQVVPPAGPAAGAAASAAIAHHDRQVARHAARTGHYRKAAASSRAANAAAVDASVAPR